MTGSKSCPPSDDVIKYDEGEHYKEYHVQHPAVVASLAHGLEALHTGAKEAPGALKILPHHPQILILVAHLVSDVNRELNWLTHKHWNNEYYTVLLPLL